MTTTMIICKRCGWEVLYNGWDWKDRMGHELCVDKGKHEPIEGKR